MKEAPPSSVTLATVAAPLKTGSFNVTGISTRSRSAGTRPVLQLLPESQRESIPNHVTVWPSVATALAAFD